MAIDSRSPWKLPREIGEFSAYPYRMSCAEWEALLARAKEGNPEAEWEVSGRFEDGCKDKGNILVRRSAREAAKWLRRAAEHGCASAQNNLGVLLGDKERPNYNPHEALAWLKRAFRAGESCAASNIAITHRQSGNCRQAVQWFRKSVASGDDDARTQLGIHYYLGKRDSEKPNRRGSLFSRGNKGKEH